MRIRFGDVDKAREDTDWKRVFAWGTKIEGTEPNHYKIELNSPLWKWVQQAEEALLEGMGNISSELMNMAGVAISGANGCVRGLLAVQVIGNKKPVEKHELLEFIHTILNKR